MSSKPPTGLPDTDDPYVLLDVRPGASTEQIRRAYLRRVKVWKPDRHPAEFRRVREAYDRLREQERWFDAWRQAGDVVQRATEEAVRAEAEAEADQEPSIEELTALEQDVEQDDAAWERGEDEEEGEDVDSLIAALEAELRDHPELDDDDDDDDGLDEPDAAAAGERGRRHLRAMAVADELAALEQQVHEALEAERWAEAADRLLEPSIDALAVRPELARLLLEVCCAVVWALPQRYEALAARYGDLVSAHDTEHHDGALLHRRILIDELPAWQAAVAGMPELHRFVVLGSSLRAPAEAELGLRLGKRGAADPTDFLTVLTRAAAEAPGITGLFVNMAERWARHYGRLSLERPARVRPTLEQAAAELSNVAQHHQRVRGEQLRPVLGSLAMVLVLLLARSPVVELVGLGVVILLWAWRAWASQPEARIYARVLRPVAAGWLWAADTDPNALAAALAARLPAPGTWGAVLHPGDLREYPQRMRDDLALVAFGVTAPMIPKLRAPGSPTG